MMAALIGGMVLVTCASMFSAMDGLDARMQARFLAAAELERARTVVARTIDTLLMSSEPQRPENSPEREQTPPRFILAPEKAPAVERTTKRARMSGAIALEAPQRLEVVLSRWPLPRGLTEERRAAMGERAGSEVPPPGPGGAVRCAFELRPADDGTWTMWWRPLPLADRGGRAAREADPAADPNAVRVISGLTKCRWTVFDDRERRSQMSSIWATQLPAYVELEIQTAAGPGGNWMFEVAWGNGKEFADEPVADQPVAPEGATDVTGNAAGGGPSPARRAQQPSRPGRRRGGP